MQAPLRAEGGEIYPIGDYINEWIESCSGIRNKGLRKRNENYSFDKK